MWLELFVAATGIIGIIGYQLIGRYFGRDLYVTINSSSMTLRDVSKAVTSSINADQESLPFSHPRALIGHYTNAEILLKRLVKSMGGFTAPRVVVHPLELIEGGLTQIEERCMTELAMGAANARYAVVHIGAPLADAEVIKKLKER